MTNGKGKWNVEWVDSGREPVSAPNPSYPNGIDVRTFRTRPDGPTCTGTLPYPAARCGYYLVKCLTCDLVIAVTTAGRRDDPRSLQIACRAKGKEQG